MKTKTLLIHNPGCSKSRSAKEILEAKNISFEVLEYLSCDLSLDLLKALPELLNMDYTQMIRSGEKLYTELKLDEKKLTSEEWMSLIQENPILLERPIFIYDQKAIIGRPPEKVLEIL